VSISPPLPPGDPLNAFFWEGAAAGRLLIQRCNACGTYIHIPRPICRNCQSFDLAPAEVSGKATLYSYTVTHKAFHPFFVDRVPYVVATVELVEQAKLHLLTNLVDVDESDITFGMALELGFEQLSPELTIPVFHPAGVVSASTSLRAAS
jgi:uncharacterized OB-fold protein